MDERTRRIAENEARFRDINERLNRDLEGLDLAGGRVTFVCECGHTDCAEPLELSCEEYTRARQDPMLFVLVPGHEITDTETVLAQGDGYVVVRKHAEAAPIVDPQP